jgi:hypothetical protein
VPGDVLQEALAQRGAAVAFDGVGLGHQRGVGALQPGVGSRVAGTCQHLVGGEFDQAGVFGAFQRAAGGGVVQQRLQRGADKAFRRGFFEGLIALGKAPLQLLKAAAEVSVSVLLLAFAVLLEVLGGYKPLAEIPGAMAQATQVYGNAIQLDRVKIGFAALPGDVIRFLNKELPRAFTTMYLLNFGPGAKVDMQTIIHELAHVWQGVQEGPLYMTRALEAQISAGLDALFHQGQYDDAASYLVTDQMLIDAGGDLKKFNPEQQATIIEAFWKARFASVPVAPGPYPTNTLVGNFNPPLDLLLPYAQQVNPALRTGPAPRRARKTAAKKRAVRPARRAAA